MSDRIRRRVVGGVTLPADAWAAIERQTPAPGRTGMSASERLVEPRVVKEYQALRPLRLAELRVAAEQWCSIGGIDALGARSSST